MMTSGAGAGSAVHLALQHGSTLHTLDTLCVGGLILFWCDSGRLGVLGN